MFVKNVKRSWRLLDSDELLRSLARVSAGRPAEFISSMKRAELTLSTFSGFVCGGGGILEDSSDEH